MKHIENQVILPLNLEIKIPDDDPVKFLNDILEQLNYSKLFSSYQRTWRKFNPKTLFKILVYAYMNCIYSSRDIERACKTNICFMWLLNGSNAPDNTTIARFQNERLLPVIEDLFYQFINLLYQTNEIKFENIFVDGTKIEANANKYTFLWKKVIENNSYKLRVKSVEKIQQIKSKYLIAQDVDISKCIDILLQQANLQNIIFVKGVGKRKTQLQRDVEYLKEIEQRQGQYSKYLELIGNNRNSLSKTDVDATFMHLKEDHMRNGQLKPAYNIQIGVESEYIVGIGSYTSRNDVNTLIPFLDNIKKHTNRIHTNVIADSGYESEENYIYLGNNNQTSYIKPTNYEKSKTSKYINNIYRIENMNYNKNNDEFTCANGNTLKYYYSSYTKTPNGYTIENRHYKTSDCSNCPHRDKCYQSQNAYREIRVSLNFINKRKQSLENISTEKGIQLRINRSIQVEGAFGIIKQDMRFRRFLTRGKNKTETQFYLLALAFNVQKMINRQNFGRFNKDLFDLKLIV